MPAGRKWLARLLLGHLGKVPAEEILQLLAGTELPALHLSRSDRRQRDVAAVRRVRALRTLTPLEAWRAVGSAKMVAR